MAEITEPYTVLCACGKRYENVTQEQWDAWQHGTKWVAGKCNCESYFKGPQ